jgi:hypothetical protein
LQGKSERPIIDEGADELTMKQVAVFFRSRAEIEEKYARSIIELGRNTLDVYARADCKAGSASALTSMALS